MDDKHMMLQVSKYEFYLKIKYFIISKLKNDYAETYIFG